MTQQHSLTEEAEVAAKRRLVAEEGNGHRPELAKALGNYPVLARETEARIKGSTLVTFPDLGHSPQVQDPARFNGALLEGLRKLPQG